MPLLEKLIKQVWNVRRRMPAQKDKRKLETLERVLRKIQDILDNFSQETRLQKYFYVVYSEHLMWSIFAWIEKDYSAHSGLIRSAEQGVKIGEETSIECIHSLYLQAQTPCAANNFAGLDAFIFQTKHLLAGNNDADIGFLHAVNAYMQVAIEYLPEYKTELMEAADWVNNCYMDWFGKTYPNFAHEIEALIQKEYKYAQPLIKTSPNFSYAVEALKNLIDSIKKIRTNTALYQDTKNKFLEINKGLYEIYAGLVSTPHTYNVEVVLGAFYQKFIPLVGTYKRYVRNELQRLAPSKAHTIEVKVEELGMYIAPENYMPLFSPRTPATAPSVPSVRKKWDAPQNPFVRK